MRWRTPEVKACSKIWRCTSHWRRLRWEGCRRHLDLRCAHADGGEAAEGVGVVGHSSLAFCTALASTRCPPNASTNVMAPQHARLRNSTPCSASMGSTQQSTASPMHRRPRLQQSSPVSALWVCLLISRGHFEHVICCARYVLIWAPHHAPGGLRPDGHVCRQLRR